MKAERKLITILFADMVRSSDIIRNFDSETVESIFNQVVTRQIEITQKFRGTVNQVMGDGIMCLFGAEAPYEEHTLRAVSAAQEMLQSISEIQKEFTGTRIQLRVGINTGEVILSPAENENYRALFKATGEAVYIADRTLKKAAANQVLVSEPCKKFLDRHLFLKSVRLLKWDGTKKPLHLYVPSTPKLACRLPVPHPAQKSVERLSAENRLAAQIAAAEKENKPKALWLWGAAGMGKTHLINSFVQKYCAESFKKIIQVNFYPDPLSHGGKMMDRTLIEGILGWDRACILADLPHIPEAVKLKETPFFEDCIKDIFSAGNLSEAYASLDIATRQRLRAEAAANLLLSKALDENIMLIIEDVHWAQEDAVAGLSRILELYEGRERLLILATSRKEPAFDRTIRDIKLSRVFLEPMTSVEAASLLEKLDTKKSLTPSVKKMIYRLSGGNPFFIHEYFSWARASVSRGLDCGAIKKHLDMHTPGMIADIVYNRLVAAGEDVVHTAKIAAILGLHINLDILQALSGRDRKTVVSHLIRLEELGVVQRSGSFPVMEWIFTHELSQKVIYNSIPQSRRSEWHETVIRQLKKRAFCATDNRHLVMASHAAKTNNELLKYVYSKWAAKEECLLSRYKSGIRLSADSRRALSRLAGRTALTKQETKARLFEISNLFMTGHYAQARKHLDVLLKRKSMLTKFGCLAETLSYHELYLWVKGDLLGAAKMAKTILSLDIQEKKSEIFIREHTRLASAYADLGHYKKSIEYDEILLRTIPDKDFEEKFGSLSQPKPGAWSRLALAYTELGQQKKSKSCFDAAYSFMEKTKDYFTKIYIIVYLANSLLSQEKNQEALKLLGMADEYCKKTDAFMAKPHVLAAYGVSHARLGYKKTGLDLCKQALLQADRNEMLSGRAQLEAWYAEALMATGDYSPARQHLRRAVISATHYQEVSNLVYAYTLLTRCYMEQPNADLKSADIYLQRTLKLARKWQMKAAEHRVLALVQKNRFNQRLGIFSA